VHCSAAAHGERLYFDRLVDYPAHALSWPI